MIIKTERILFIDTETGGIDPNKHSLLSIGLVVWENGKILDKCEILVKERKIYANRNALMVNKINIFEHEKKALAPRRAIDLLLKVIKNNFTEGELVTLAGHNVNFDVSFLKRFLEKRNIKFKKYFSHRIIDTAPILYYLYLSGKIQEKAVSSDKAFKLFKINIPERHTALADAIGTAELFTKLIKL